MYYFESDTKAETKDFIDCLLFLLRVVWILSAIGVIVFEFSYYGLK